MKYLYHYTSLETLALILRNKTICFNNLLYVDDLDEAETEDMGKFGKFVYVSCWTEDSEESIPLWNLYTPNMHGVRIRMPEFPFKKYRFKKGEYFLSINEQISNFAQTYPTNLKASSNEALLFMRRYRFANCSCFSCCFKDAYPSSNVQ